MGKWILSFLAFSLFCFFIPQLGSTSWTRKQIETLLENHLGGTVSIEKLSLSWWSPQHCKNVKWMDPRKGIAIQADQILIPSGLVDCFRTKTRPLDLEVEGAKCFCQANLRLIKKKKKKDLAIHFSSIHATVCEGKISFDRTDVDVTETLKIVTWGMIDLEKNHMNLTFGLPPKAMEKIFHKKNLSADFLLEIPISCELNSKALEKKLLSFFLKNYATVTSLQR